MLLVVEFNNLGLFSFDLTFILVMYESSERRLMVKLYSLYILLTWSFMLVCVVWRLLRGCAVLATLYMTGVAGSDSRVWGLRSGLVSTETLFS